MDYKTITTMEGMQEYMREKGGGYFGLDGDERVHYQSLKAGKEPKEIKKEVVKEPTKEVEKPIDDIFARLHREITDGSARGAIHQANVKAKETSILEALQELEQDTRIRRDGTFWGKVKNEINQLTKNYANK